MSRAVDRRAYADVAVLSPPARLDHLDVLLMLRAAGVDAPVMSEIDPSSAATRLTSLIRADVDALRSAEAAPQTLARLDALVGTRLHELVRNRVTGVRQLLELSHDHPRSGRHLGEALRPVLR